MEHVATCGDMWRNGTWRGVSFQWQSLREVLLGHRGDLGAGLHYHQGGMPKAS